MTQTQDGWSTQPGDILADLNYARLQAQVKAVNPRRLTSSELVRRIRRTADMVENYLIGQLWLSWPGGEWTCVVTRLDDRTITRVVAGATQSFEPQTAVYFRGTAAVVTCNFGFSRPPAAETPAE